MSEDVECETEELPEHPDTIHSIVLRRALMSDD